MNVSRRYVGLGLLACGLGAYGVWSARVGAETADTLSVQEADAAVQAGTLLLIDIRRPDEWAATGIARGAVPIDMRRRDFPQALEAAKAGAPNARVALICARGVRSRRLTRALERAGFDAILDVPEGMLGSSSGPGWIAAGLPLETWTQG